MNLEKNSPGDSATGDAKIQHPQPKEPQPKVLDKWKDELSQTLKKRSHEWYDERKMTEDWIAACKGWEQRDCQYIERTRLVWNAKGGISKDKPYHDEYRDKIPWEALNCLIDDQEDIGELVDRLRDTYKTDPKKLKEKTLTKDWIEFAEFLNGLKWKFDWQMKKSIKQQQEDEKKQQREDEKNAKEAKPKQQQQQQQQEDEEDAEEAERKYKGPQLHGADLRWVLLPKSDFKKAALQGSSLQDAVLCGACLETASLHGSCMKHVCLQGANLKQAVLNGANIECGQIQKADLTKAQLHKVCLSLADLRGATLKKANLAGANLEGANLTGADLEDADLTDANLKDAILQDAKLKGVLWTTAPHCAGAKCTPLSKPKFARSKKRPAKNAWLFRILISKLKKSLQGGDEDDDDDGDDDEGDADSEDGEGKDGEDEAKRDAEDGGGVCDTIQNWFKGRAERLQDKAMGSYTKLASDCFDRVADKAAAFCGRLSDQAQQEAMNLQATAKKGLNKMNDKVKAAAKDQRKKALKFMDGKQFTAAMERDPKLRTWKNTLMETDLGEDLGKELKNFQDTLKDLENGGLNSAASWAMQIGESQLASASGYSSGELLTFLKVSPKKMSEDTAELEDMLDYVTKLQDTVNKNNWDDVVDNFMCLYNLRLRLTGERSRVVFRDIWSNEQLRNHVGAGNCFQNVARPDVVPDFVIHEVKGAVQIVKDNAVGWRQALRREIAAIERMKNKQADFFAFLISAISGFFVFIATFLSGLALDAVREGKFSLPFLSVMAGNGTSDGSDIGSNITLI
mmetsp:Transcript_1490/g.3776  ORF Transcript_1490/g.3776 Transcript_1490/m.3776 type:complete len:796 (-) Transcript_1490:106-2493(-)